jgi:hypothetical protein
MSHSNRRRFLKNLLQALAQGTGAIVLASTATAQAQAPVTDSQGNEGQDTDIQKRAEELAGAAGTDEQDLEVAFFNISFNPGFRNGGVFRNGGLFRPGFRNGGFLNGAPAFPFANVPWFNGVGFQNGGWGNGWGPGFRNGAFRNW